MRVLVVAKDDWNSPPRIRHQVAGLLAERGHEVLFVQHDGSASSRSPVPPQLKLANTHDLIHHQLRLHPWLVEANARRAVVALTDALRLFGAPDVVLNFRYDWHFLRSVFPRTRIVTLVNDDFIDGAKWFARPHVRQALLRTLEGSDHGLAVSYPLVRQIRPHIARADLFLPWSRIGYRAPTLGRCRPALLYWGYINERLDVEALTTVLDSGTKIHFVGPVTPSRRIDGVLRHGNATLHPPCGADELVHLAQDCAASILPYDTNQPMIRALTASNRSFDLLSLGLPLIYPELPDLLAAPPGIIYRCSTPQNYVDVVDAARDRFDHVQSDIAAFLEAHSPAARYNQLLAVLEAA